jgi:hypothetical protein
VKREYESPRPYNVFFEKGLMEKKHSCRFELDSNINSRNLLKLEFLKFYDTRNGIVF